jgi:hypothetical protein
MTGAGAFAGRSAATAAPPVKVAIAATPPRKNFFIEAPNPFFEASARLDRRP